VAEHRAATEGKAAFGAEVSQMLKQLTDEQSMMVRLVAWAPTGNNRRSGKEAAT
jgi:hypothetical protein